GREHRTRGSHLRPSAPALVRPRQPRRRRSMLGQGLFDAILDRLVECAPDGGQFAGWELTGATGLSRMKAMAKHRIHSIEFKRQIAQDFIAGETLHALAGRHDVSRNLIRIWVRKFEAGAFDDEARAADLLQDYEAKIAALERMVGRQALEIEFLKGALKSAP